MPSQDVRFAVFTKPWPADSIEELADRVRDLGFDGAEVPVRPGFQVEPETAEKGLPELVERFADRQLSVVSIASVLEEAVFAACAAAGVTLIRVMAPVTRGRYLESQAKLQRLLADAVPLCERYGVRVGVQQHYGDNVTDAVGLRSLLEGVDDRWVGAIWDAAHDALAGLAPESGLDVVWDRLLMVNLKNAFYVRTNGPEAETAQWSRHFTSGAHGMASWPRVAAELQRRNYHGAVCLTAEYTDENAVERLCRDDLVYAKGLFE
jgi:sugar phosphate isomerase/epimerase